METFRLVLIGGASCSGKSTLCRKLHTLTAIPYFHIDCLGRGVFHAMKSIKFPDDLTHWDMTEAIIPGLINRIIQDGESYMIEGADIAVDQAARIRDRNKSNHISISFMGYPSANVANKVKIILSEKTPRKAWLRKRPLSLIEDHIKRFVEISNRDLDLCKKYGIKFYDTSIDFPEVVQKSVIDISKWINSFENKQM